MLTHEMRRAYAETRYLVIDAAGETEGWVGRPSASLAGLLARHGAASGIVITAWNPKSQPQARARNDAAGAALAAGIAAAGLRALPCRGQGTTTDWWEDGLMVLDLPAATAIGMAEQYGQYAVTAFDRDGFGRLLFTRLAGRPG